MSNKWFGFLAFIWICCMFLGSTFEGHTEAAGDWGGVTNEEFLEATTNMRAIEYQESNIGIIRFIGYGIEYFDNFVQMITWDFTFLRGRQADGTADGGTASTLTDSTKLIQSNNWWNEATLVILTTTDGLAPQGESRPINDFDAATDELQFDAMTATVDAGDTYDIRSGQGYEMFRWIVLTPFSLCIIGGFLILFIQVIMGFVRI